MNAPDLAYCWGMPDSPLSIGSHAVAIALAAGATTGLALIRLDP